MVRVERIENIAFTRDGGVRPVLEYAGSEAARALWINVRKLRQAEACRTSDLDR